MSIFDLFKKIEKPRPSGPVEYIVCCLGNPGREYENTRHNCGFMTAAALSKMDGFVPKRLKFESLYGDFVYEGHRFILLLPQTFMNDSGRSALAALGFYKLPPEKLLVICDDLELPPGRIRIRQKGSDGGHKGLKSIIYHLSSNDFPRIRIGIGRPQNPDFQVTDWVLGRFTEQERKLVEPAILRAREAVLEILTSSVDSAMSKYNGKNSE